MRYLSIFCCLQKASPNMTDKQYGEELAVHRHTRANALAGSSILTHAPCLCAMWFAPSLWVTLARALFYNKTGSEDSTTTTVDSAAKLRSTLSRSFLG